MIHDDFIGQIVGDRYEVVRAIGRGAMGAIYEVRHLKLKRGFALKRLVLHLADNPEALQRFQREADLIAQLRHPNIVEIVDWELLADQTPCMVMELLRGEDLDHRIRREGALSWAQIVRVGEQVLSALGVAHRAGIVHRDLKPQNVYLARDDADEEHVKLLDFGVSKIGGDDTNAGRLIGTPAYMAPEQADGRGELGPAADLWAMGALLQEMATGTPAFPGSSTRAITYRICHGEPERIDARRPDAPAAFVALIARAFAKEPRDRFVDADEMRRALRELAPSLPASAPPKVTPAEIDTAPTLISSAMTTTLSRAAVARTNDQRLERGAPVWRAAIAAGILVVGAVGWRWLSASTHDAAKPVSTSASMTAPAPAASPTTPPPVAPVAPAPVASSPAKPPASRTRPERTRTTSRPHPRPAVVEHAPEQKAPKVDPVVRPLSP